MRIQVANATLEVKKVIIMSFFLSLYRCTKVYKSLNFVFAQIASPQHKKSQNYGIESVE